MNLFNGLWLYAISLLFYFGTHKNLQQLHMYNRLIASFFSITYPIYILFNRYYLGNELLTDSYYQLLTMQMGYYIFDIIPVILLGDFEQITHHVLGPILNYTGYYYRYEKVEFHIMLAIYFLEQGVHIFHCLMKICDYNNFKKSNIRNIFKKMYFSTIKLFFLLKFILTLIIHGLKGYKIASFFYLQLVWNYYILKKAKIL